MNNYRVSFFKIERKLSEETGELERTGKEEYVGSVVVDDCGVDNTLTLEAKAFRRAPINCLYADKTKVERLS